MRKVLITGGSRGIGKATAEKFIKSSRSSHIGGGDRLRAKGLAAEHGRHLYISFCIAHKYIIAGNILRYEINRDYQRILFPDAGLNPFLLGTDSRWSFWLLI